MRAERRDINEAEIVDGLREAGALVWRLCAKEMSDLVVLWREPFGLWLLEVKRGKVGRLTAKQRETHAAWPVHVVSTLAEALQVCRGGV